MNDAMANAKSIASTHNPVIDLEVARVGETGSGTSSTSSRPDMTFRLGATTRSEPGWYPIRPAGMNVGEGGAVARSLESGFEFTKMP